MRTRSLILSLLILIGSVVTISAQSIPASLSANLSANPGRLSQPYVPTGQQVRLVAYHPASGERDGAVTSTFPIAAGEKFYNYTTSIQEVQPVVTAQYTGATVTVPDAQLEYGCFATQPSQIMVT